MAFTLSTFPKESDFWTSAQTEVLATIATAIERYGSARIGISGGTTPLPLYRSLAQVDLPWEKIVWVLLDERCVPRGNAESNWTQVQAALNERGQVPLENWVAFDTALPMDEAVLTMQKHLAALLEQRRPLLDGLILGVGADGHIASLFDGDPFLETRDSAYVTEAPASYSTQMRLTLSLKTLTQASRALLLIHGVKKQPVLRALKGTLRLSLIVLYSLFERIPVTILSFMEDE